MTANQLFHQIKEKKSFLCVGLDTDLNKIPRMLLDFEYPIFEFNKQIVDATADFTIAYKPNLAFYEMHGAAGWVSLEMTVNYIREKYPEIFIIADAKRGDIGNTSGMYAKAFFEKMDFDAITVSPYMGSDSVMPFLEYKNKWVIVLALTSNQGAEDFQYSKSKSSDKMLYEQVLQTSSIWGTTNNIMYVVGATKAEMLTKIRTIVPDHFLLVPGVGAQGEALKMLPNTASIANGVNRKFIPSYYLSRLYQRFC
jgi:orotidine-5'-phosphate decarboxylase